MAATRTPTRVLVLGSPGAGKSTFARWLAAESGLPIHHLDDDHWGPGWARPDPEWWARHQGELVRGDRWVIDGNYLPTLPLRTARAQLVVLVDTPTWLCLLRIVRRAWRIRAGRYRDLPAEVRTQATAGVPVRATKDFRHLIGMVARFRRKDWPSVVAHAGRSPATVLVAVRPGVLGSRLASVRARLDRLDVTALVHPIDAAREATRALVSGGPLNRPTTGEGP